jgi:hypothetical protein
MELDDPRMIKRAFTDPQQTQMEQMEEQAEELVIMLNGFPAVVEPKDDDKAHIQSIEGFVQRRVQTGEPITSELARLILQHGADHDNALAQKGDPALNQIRAQMKPMLDYLSNILAAEQQQMQQAGQMPSNVVPGPGGMGPQDAEAGPPAPGGTGTVDPVRDATLVMNALATLKKSGVPVTDSEVNTALAAAGLPPLSTGTPIPEPIKPEPVNIERAPAEQGGTP